MQIGGWPRPCLRGSRLPLRDLSPAARQRLQALEVWRLTGRWQEAARLFALSRATLYRWRQRVQPLDLATLEARSRRPRRIRQPQTPPAVMARLRALRAQYPRWGRAKLHVLLAREGLTVSAKTIDRVLARLRAHGQLAEPPRCAISVRRRPQGGPMRSVNPGTMARSSPGISSKWIRWMSGRSPAWSSNRSRPAMWCPGGMSWRPTAGPPPPPLPSS
jgi:transposase